MKFEERVKKIVELKKIENWKLVVEKLVELKIVKEKDKEKLEVVEQVKVTKVTYKRNGGENEN